MSVKSEIPSALIDKEKDSGVNVAQESRKKELEINEKEDETKRRTDAEIHLRRAEAIESFLQRKHAAVEKILDDVAFIRDAQAGFSADTAQEFQQALQAFDPEYGIFLREGLGKVRDFAESVRRERWNETIQTAPSYGPYSDKLASLESSQGKLSNIRRIFQEVLDRQRAATLSREISSDYRDMNKERTAPIEAKGNVAHSLNESSETENGATLLRRVNSLIERIRGAHEESGERESIIDELVDIYRSAEFVPEKDGSLFHERYADSCNDAMVVLTKLILTQNTVRSPVSKISSLFKKPPSPVDRSVANDFCTRIIQSYGLPPQGCIEKWKSVGYGESLRENIAFFAHTGADLMQARVSRNIQKIQYIEKVQPGVAAFLYEDRGIANFDRYSSGMLLKQYEEKDNLDMPYGISVTAEDDWNSGLDSVGSHLDKFSEKLKENCLLRIFESAGKRELAKRLIQLDKKYGSEGKNKIRFTIVNGHGFTKYHITLKRGTVWASVFPGALKSDGSIHKDDFRGAGFSKSRKFFDPNAWFILAACSAGKKGGIAEKGARLYGASFVAPDKTQSGLLDSVDPVFDDSGQLITFSVNEKNADPQQESVKNRVFHF